MKIKGIIIICLSAILLSCSSASKKRNEAISKGVYATSESIDVGRIDLADKYIKQVIKLVPPPDKKIPIASFRVLKPELRETAKTKGPISRNQEGYFGFDDKIDTEPVVVLPERFQNKPVIIENSPEYIKLVNENESLKKQLEDERAELAKFQNKVEDAQRAQAKELAKAEEPKKTNWFAWITGGAGIMSVLGITGVIVLCILFPPLMPLFLNFFQTIFSSVISFINFILKQFNKK